MGRILFICSLLMTAWVLQNCSRVESDPLEARARFWTAGLDGLDRALVDLESACRSGASDPVLQSAFREARLRYKELEFLFEYAFPQTAVQLNGPAVDEVEPEGTLVPAAGLQVLEASVFPRRAGTPEEAAARVASMRVAVRGVRGAASFEPVGRSLYPRPAVWTDSSVLDAVRLELFRLGTLGITGFDSPVSQASLPETRAALAAMDAYLEAAFPAPRGRASRSLRALREALAAAAREAHSPVAAAGLPAAGASDPSGMDADGKAFDAFDRLGFLRWFLNPAYALLGEFQEAVAAPLPGEARAFSPASRDLFAGDAWDPAFFSPYEKRDGGRPSPEAEARRAALGRRLFSDPVLSGDGSRSCATCHRPGQGFGDGLRRSVAMGSSGFVARNAPSLIHAALQQGSFWDLRAESLEDQAFEVIHNPAEMGGALEKASAALSADPGYAAAFQAAFAGDPDTDRDRPVSGLRIRRALAAYIRSLVPFDSPWDRYMRGEDGALAEDARRGFNVFMGKGRCATCHFPPLFNGTVPPLYLATDVEVLGVPAEPMPRPGVLSPDSGRMAVDGQPISRGAFRTPTVRNAAFTAPYMHNGVFATLEEVVEFYDAGGGAGRGLAVPNQTLPSDSLHLTPREEEDLLAFLRALSDTAGTTAVEAPAARLTGTGSP